MGLGRRAMVYLGLAEEDDDYLDDDYDDDGHDDAVRGAVREDRRTTVDPVPIDRSVRRIEAREEPVAMSRRPPVEHLRPSAPTPMRRVAPVEEPRPYRITTLQPRSYNEARQIGEEFRDGTPVIMNLTEMDDVDAKRLVDFAAGLIFGLRGAIEKVTNKVFLLSPHNVEVTETDKRRIREGGFYNQS
ncbi:cell division inhibitor SepF [Parafrankia irregularis]|uniref:Cell division protein SepF n=1 Tax=Parafrankia irregularis TaxID=795642 RepID=A0A0S4QVU5_9ACTN|nr:MULTISPECIES: cell division protein SepF [Parafrankia]MBE3201951.1 cell division protein SepF [Parafrankia sp. CH37]CUU59460.1 cell division inhibitor SepF [Parafrankia irregularis]